MFKDKKSLIIFLIIVAISLILCIFLIIPAQEFINEANINYEFYLRVKALEIEDLNNTMLQEYYEKYKYNLKQGILLILSVVLIAGLNIYNFLTIKKGLLTQEQKTELKQQRIEKKKRKLQEKIKKIDGDGNS
jgi:hypothetical protein